MKQNLLVLSYDYELSKHLAKVLAEEFSMRFFDQKELFEFDHLPHTFSEVCEAYGLEYVKKKLRSIVKMELDFDDAVFVADIALVDNCFDLFYKIKLSNFVVLLEKKTDAEFAELSAKKYTSKKEQEFYAFDRKLLIEREFAVKKDLADAVIDITNKTDSQIIDEIVDKIKKYYSVN